MASSRLYRLQMGEAGKLAHSHARSSPALRAANASDSMSQHSATGSTKREPDETASFHPSFPAPNVHTSEDDRCSPLPRAYNTSVRSLNGCDLWYLCLATEAACLPVYLSAHLANDHLLPVAAGPAIREHDQLYAGSSNASTFALPQPATLKQSYRYLQFAPEERSWTRDVASTCPTTASGGGEGASP
ncbi:hypothetical protein EJ07DRAFT_157499 [Lizonia empirigonia]|nr:hypothetical protein EJ07DRAFT_157499 [Lizonia empirigonia]